MKSKLLFSLLVIFLVSCGGSKTTEISQEIKNVDTAKVNELKRNLKQEISSIISVKKFDFNSKSDDYYSIKFGKYNDSDIEWIVLDKDNTRAILMTKYIIDFKRFDNKNECNWEKSEIRKWLNSDFYSSSFSDEEQFCIEPVQLNNYYSNSFYSDVNYWYNQPQSVTTDRVFLLAQNEHIFYGGAESTKFASASLDSINMEDIEGFFWERTKDDGLSSRTAMIITDKGNKFNQDNPFYRNIKSTDCAGVRPIICVKYSDNEEVFNIASSIKTEDNAVTFQLPTTAVRDKKSQFNHSIYHIDDIDLEVIRVSIRQKEKKYDWDMSIELAHSLLKETLKLNIDSISDFALMKVSDSDDNAFRADIGNECIVGISMRYDADKRIVLLRFSGNNKKLIDKILDSVSLKEENWFKKYVREHPDVSNKDKVQTFVINLSTGVFHRESCRAAKIMKSSNRSYVNSTSKELNSKGYHSCDVCNP